MDEAKIAAFAVAVVAVFGLFVMQQISMKRRLKRMLAAREPIPAADFGSRYYTDPSRAEIATFIVQTIEEITDHDFTGALPSDRWSDLHLDELDSLVSVEIVQEVERRFDIMIGDAEATQIVTLADFVGVVFSKTTCRQDPPFTVT